MNLVRAALVALAALVGATGAHAQIAFRGAASAGIASVSASSIVNVGAGAASIADAGCPRNVSPAMPTGLANDVLVALVNSREDNATIGATAGWTLAYSATYGGGNDLQAYIYYKVATGTDTAADPLTVTQSGTCGSLAAQVSRFRGVDTAQPLETSPIPAGNVVQQNTNDLDTGTQTTTLNGSMLLVAGFINNNRTVTEGVGWSEAFDSSLNLARDLGVSLHYMPQASAGAASISNWAFSGGGAENFGVIFALRPQVAVSGGLTINVPAGTVADDVMVASIAVRPFDVTPLAPGSTIITDVGAGAESIADAGCPRNVSPAMPTGLANDVLVALVNSREDNATIGATAGWTLAYSATYGGGNDLQAYIYYKVATGTDTAADPLTVTQSGSCGSLAAQVSRFRGVDTAQPLETSPIPAGNVVQQNTDNLDTGTQTTTLNGSMLLVAGFINNNRTVTEGVGWSEAFDSSLNLARDLGVSLHYMPQASAGAASISNWAFSGGGAENFGVIFALRPVPSTALWTQVRSTPQTAGNSSRMVTYTRVATASEPASYTWTFSGGTLTGAAGGILSFSGVDTLAPVDAEGGNTTPSNTSHTANAITTTVANAMLVGSFEYTSVPSDWTPPAGMTEAVDQGSVTPPNGAGIKVEMAYATQATAGTSGAKTATSTGDGGADTGVAHLLSLRPKASVVNHYAITVLSNSVANCDYAEVTITAHADIGHVTTVNPLSTTAVTLSTSGVGAGSGVWQSPPIAGTGTWTPSGANDGAATYQWPGSESSFTVRLRQSAVTSLNVTLIDTDAKSEDPGEDPTITFANSALRISDGANAALAIGRQLSGKPSDTGFGLQNLFLQAIRTDTVTGACISLLPSGAEADIEVGAQCVNPVSCASNVTLTTQAASGNSGTFVPGAAGTYPSTIKFRFTTANAEAPFYFSYADAGQISLQFRYALPSPPAGVNASGSNGPFVVRPFGLRVSGVSTSAAPAPTDAVFVKAGANFNAAVTAVQWKAGDDADADGVPDTDAQIAGNSATPNFGLEASAAGATLSHTLNAPGGGAAGTLGGSTNYTGFSAGTKTQAVNWSEVGFINLFAQSFNYQGTGETVRNSAAGLTGVGRFYPDHFFLAGGSTLTNRLATSCASTFSYLDEGIGLALTLQARNTANAVTQNYTTASGYARLNPATVASLGLGALSGATNLTARIDTALGSAGSFAAGAASITARPSVRRATPDNPDGPFTAARVGIAPADADGVVLRTADLDMDVDGVGGNDRQQVGTDTELRFGRLRLQNGFGPDSVGLQIPLDLQYWNGSGFALNALDSCTTLARSDIALTFTGVIAACDTAVQEASIAFASGQSVLTLSAPGAGKTGSVVLTANLGTAAGTYCPASPATASPAIYLLGRWDDSADPDADANTAYDDKPTGRATFGLYGSQPKNFIFFRENY